MYPQRDTLMEELYYRADGAYRNLCQYLDAIHLCQYLSHHFYLECHDHHGKVGVGYGWQNGATFALMENQMRYRQMSAVDQCLRYVCVLRWLLQVVKGGL